MTVVDEICDKLSAKHGEKYTPKRCRSWANLIQLQKHDAYDSLSNKHLFTIKSRRTVAAVGARVSPSKRIIMCLECMSQLDKWLAARGIISENQGAGQDYVRYSEGLSKCNVVESEHNNIIIMTVYIQ